MSAATGFDPVRISRAFVSMDRVALLGAGMVGFALAPNAGFVLASLFLGSFGFSESPQPTATCSVGSMRVCAAG